MLDVGSGDGFWTTRFGRHCRHVTGLEPDHTALCVAQQLHQRGNVAYVRGIGEALPFPSASFSKVVSVSCLEHFANPLEGLRDMARVLKPGGRLALSVDSLLPDNSPASFRDWHRRRHFVTTYFSSDRLLSMMKQVGLDCEPERTIHLFRSRLAAAVRQTFICSPRMLLPLFPVFYTVAVTADRAADDTHGQIIIVTATRNSKPTQEA
jgi:SAM-dependent methyltransferase